MRRVLAGLFLLHLASGKAFGYSIPKFLEREFLSQTLSRGLTAYPLAKSSKELKIVPAFFTYSFDGRGTPSGAVQTFTQSGTGWAGSASFAYGFNPHFGISIFGGHFSQNGTVEMGAGATGSFPGYHDSFNTDYGNNGQAFAFSLIYDPFKKPDGFRLPMMLGAAYIRIAGSITFDFDYGTPPAGYPQRELYLSRAGHKGRIISGREIDSFGYFLGVAPQFNTGPVRWIPFIFDFAPTKNFTFTQREFDLTLGQEKPTTATMGGGSNAGAIGLEVVYLPLGLSVTYIPRIPAIFDESASNFYSFKWTKKWGAEPNPSEKN